MAIVKESTIKEIAKEVAIGNTCYVHRSTMKITTIDHSLEDEKLIAAQAKKEAEMDAKIERYVRIAKPSVDDQLEMMEYFIEEFQDKSIRKQLSNALRRKNPIRNFMQTIESDMELQLHWGNFSRGEYQRWVSNFIIDSYNY